jgi:hypothetical protein
MLKRKGNVKTLTGNPMEAERAEQLNEQFD